MKTFIRVLLIGIPVGLIGAWLVSDHHTEPVPSPVVVPPSPVAKCICEYGSCGDVCACDGTHNCGCLVVNKIEVIEEVLPHPAAFAPCGCRDVCYCDPCMCAGELSYEQARQVALRQKKHFVAIIGDADPGTFVFQKDIVCVRISRAEWVRINRVYPAYATDGYAVGRYEASEGGWHALTFFETRLGGADVHPAVNGARVR